MVIWLSALMVSLAVGVGAFLAVRALTGGGSEATAEETQDTKREPGWWVPYQHEDVKKPLAVQQTIHGILVGLAVENGRHDACLAAGSEPEYVPAEEAARSDLEPEPGYLPDGVVLTSAGARVCGETVVSFEKEYRAPYVPGEADPNVPFQTGGSIWIGRFLMPNDRIQLTGVAERFRAATINDKPAVVLEPLMPDGVDAGFYEGKIVMKEPDGFTMVVGRGLPWAEFLKIAENLR